MLKLYLMGIQKSPHSVVDYFSIHYLGCPIAVLLPPQIPFAHLDAIFKEKVCVQVSIMSVLCNVSHTLDLLMNRSQPNFAR